MWRIIYSALLGEICGPSGQQVLAMNPLWLVQRILGCLDSEMDGKTHIPSLLNVLLQKSGRANELLGTYIDSLNIQ